MFGKRVKNKNWHDYVETRLSAYIDGELPEDERSQVRKHLGECPQCQASLDSLGWTIRLVKQVPAPALPRQFTLPVTSPAPARAPASSGWLRWGFAAASAMAVLVVALLLSRDLFPSASALPTTIALAPAAAPAAAQPTTAAAKSQAPNPAADNSTGALQSVPASPPALAAPPVAATAAPQVGSEFAAAPTLTPSMRSLASPLTTPPCSNCGGGPILPPSETPAAAAAAPSGMGGGVGTPTPGAQMGIMGAGAGPALPATFATGIVNVEMLNVRAAPDAAGLRLGWLADGTLVPVAGRDRTGKWIEIVFMPTEGPQQLGWAEAQYVLLNQPFDALPVLLDNGMPATTP